MSSNWQQDIFASHMREVVGVHGVSTVLETLQGLVNEFAQEIETEDKAGEAPSECVLGYREVERRIAAAARSANTNGM
jgi:hypothetical protein